MYNRYDTYRKCVTRVYVSFLSSDSLWNLFCANVYICLFVQCVRLCVHNIFISGRVPFSITVVRSDGSVCTLYTYSTHSLQTHITHIHIDIKLCTLRAHELQKVIRRTNPKLHVRFTHNPLNQTSHPVPSPPSSYSQPNNSAYGRPIPFSIYLDAKRKSE